MVEINIVGKGVFGKFLEECFRGHATFSETADTVILAVPVSAYEAVAEKYAGKHLVNVCSVQRKTNEACLKHSKYVTGIHPMFGAKSPKEGRTCIVTHTCEKSGEIIRLFEKVGAEIVTQIGDKKIDGKIHDDMMRRTHMPVLAFGELAALIVEQAAGIPDNCLPTSFKRLQALAEQMKDMSPGTVESIRSNMKNES
jgi:prephenate dehydrogenase